MKTFELVPITSHKSFYGKAKVIEENNISKLLSYDTIVAEYNQLTNKMQVNGTYSDTTMRHINAFLVLYGFDKCSKKQIEEFYL